VFEVVALTFALEPGVDTVTLTVCDFVVVPTVPFTVIVVVPAATPVTTPADVTVATDTSLDWNVDESPLIVAPFWSFADTVKFCVPFTTTLTFAGVTLNDVNTGVGPVLPPPSPPPLHPANATRAATARTRAFRIKPP
jgi:hypothetical protein